MKFRVIDRQTSHTAQSPVRVIEQSTGREVGWVNRYLDREYVRRLAPGTLRLYADNLLHFVRWWDSVHHTDAVAAEDLSESTLLDYVRFQSGKEPRPAGTLVAPAPQSMPVSRSRIVRCVMSFPVLFVRWLHTFNKPIYIASQWSWEDLNRL